jgi:sugar transferase (PEP-CTERM/EpsH1 system associated)
MDFCDLDSDKWAQFAQSKSWPLRWVYGREARQLALVERDLAMRFDHSLFVSELESGLFRSLHPEIASKVTTLGNGVNTDYFEPTQVSVNADKGSQVVFTGAMDYWANVDAVTWFAHEVWPQILSRFPKAHFSIVGSNPTAEVLQLGRLAHVTVTGRVPDVRPWLQAAAVVVAPLRIARGVQNKVLEAMSMARPVVATSAALQGLGDVDSPSVYRADSATEFAEAVCRQLARSGTEAAEDNRRFVLRRFSWTAALEPLWPLLGIAA